MSHTNCHINLKLSETRISQIKIGGFNAHYTPGCAVSTQKEPFHSPATFSSPEWKEEVRINIKINAISLENT